MPNVCGYAHFFVPALGYRVSTAVGDSLDEVEEKLMIPIRNKYGGVPGAVFCDVGLFQTDPPWFKFF